MKLNDKYEIIGSGIKVAMYYGCNKNLLTLKKGGNYESF